MRKLVYILIILVSLTGCKKCKKTTSTTVSGLVLDRVTNNPIANATVYLGIVTSGVGGVTASTVDKVASDAIGRYSFEFTATQGKDYYIIGSAPNYFETESASENPIQENKKNESFNISLRPIAVIKIHIKKTDISYDSLNAGFWLKEIGTTTVAFGKNLDTNIIYKNQVAGKNISIFIYVQKYLSGSLISTNIDTLKNVYLLSVDTTRINLNY